MKKILALILALVTLTLCFTSCGSSETIEIDPRDINMPDSYQLVYTIVERTQEGEKITRSYTVGCDAKGNFASLGMNQTDGEDINEVYIAKSSNSFEKYVDEGVGSYSFSQSGVTWGGAVCIGDAGYAYNRVVNRGAKYEKIESIDLPDALEGQNLLFLDTARFDYYKVIDVNNKGVFQTAVEKKTGACVYVYYDEYHYNSDYYDEQYHYYGEYYIYASEYTTPYNGDYSTLIQ